MATPQPDCPSPEMDATSSVLSRVPHGGSLSCLALLSVADWSLWLVCRDLVHSRCPGWVPHDRLSSGTDTPAAGSVESWSVLSHSGDRFMEPSLF